jgi:hypothetical protein
MVTVAKQRIRGGVWVKLTGWVILRFNWLMASLMGVVRVWYIGSASFWVGGEGVLLLLSLKELTMSYVISTFGSSVVVSSPLSLLSKSG